MGRLRLHSVSGVKYLFSSAGCYVVSLYGVLAERSLRAWEFVL